METTKTPEEIVKNRHMASGYQCIKNGWPDFLFYKLNDKGEIIEWFFKEVKRDEKEPLNYNQKRCLDIFKKIGFKVEVEYAHKIKKQIKERKYYIKSPENKKAYFFPAEWNRFFELLTDKQKISFKFMIQMGARINEIRNIRVNDIDFERDFIKLRITKCRAVTGEKDSMPREVSVSTQFSKWLEKHIKHQKLKQNDYFKILSTNQLNLIIKDTARAINNSKWKDMSCHNIRKTFITWGYALDVDPNKLALHVGHDVRTAMKHYASGDILNREDKRIARDIWGDLFIK